MKKLMIIGLLLAILVGCRSMERKKFENDPYYETFFVTARFIMTGYERKMYKMLPDKTSKELFIKEFWQRRDPTPDTEENENYDEFQNRIYSANKWFRERTKGQGWNTVRGRILLQLGFPIERRRDQFNLRNQTKSVPYEVWWYPRYELALQFIDWNDSGKFEILNPPPGLLSAIDEAIYEFDIDKKFVNKSSFKFKGKYKNGQLNLIFPTKHLLFKEVDDSMTVQFAFDISIFFDYKKIDSFKVTKDIKELKSDLLNKKDITISFPYELKEKGKYHFDVLVTDTINSARYRRYFSHKN